MDPRGSSHPRGAAALVGLWIGAVRTSVADLVVFVADWGVGRRLGGVVVGGGWVDKIYGCPV